MERSMEWQVESRNSFGQSSPSGPWVFIVDEHRQAIAEVFLSTDPKVAQLIAAAPEMLEALQAIRALFAGDPKGEYVISRADGKPLCLADQMIIGSRFIDKADAVIAKATGAQVSAVFAPHSV